MKKNIDAGKKKLAEKTSAADTLHKTLSESKKENSELQRKVTELEAEVAELSPEGSESVKIRERIGCCLIHDPQKRRIVARRGLAYPAVLEPSVEVG